MSQILRQNQNSRLISEVWREKQTVLKSLSTNANEESRSNFKRELAALKDLNGLPGFPVLLAEDGASYRREFVAGEDLSALAGKISFEDLLDLAVSLWRIVQRAHTRQIVLGDIKPANIVRSSKKEIVFVDLSLAYTITSDTVRSGGSPAYMAPELFYGGTPSFYSDAYALGVTLYQLTRGRLPFEAKDFEELARLHWLEDPADPTIGTPFPRAWGAFLLRLMNKNPAERPVHANELIRFANAHFETSFTEEPVAERLRTLVKDFESQNEAKKLAERTIKILSAKKDRTPQEAEFAARLAVRNGLDDLAALFLPNLDKNVVEEIQAASHLKKGHYDEAKRLAESLLSRGHFKALNVLGTCAYYAAEYAAARGHYLKLTEYFLEQSRFADLIPVLNNLANAEVALKEISSAEEHYSQSLALAKLIGNPKQEALALVSHGYLLHTQGRWARALGAYSSAAEIYHWLGLNRLEYNALVNIAGASALLGLTEKSRSIAEDLSRTGKRDQMTPLVAHALLIEADLARHSGHFSDAAPKYRKAAEIFAKAGNEPFRRAAKLNQIRAEIEDGKSPLLPDDLDAEQGQRLNTYTALAEMRRKAKVSPETVKKLEAIAFQRDALPPDDTLEILKALYAQASRLGNEESAKACAARFHEIKSRAAEGLPEEAVAAFNAAWELPESPAGEGRFSRALMELATNLISELDTDTLVRRCLDRLIEATRSERGFILLKDGGRGRIAISRNFGRKDLGEEERRISWSLARQAIDSAKPLVTLDAQSDERFELTDSVHSLKLRTVICLPFVHRGDVLGAIYLDSKAAPASHGYDLIAALEPFAAQLATAIANARLFGETRRDLDVARKEIEKLKKTVALQDEANGLIFRSAAMMRVIDLVNRVATTGIPVLITGESGVGKERIARLIHEKSARKSKPFVSVNCGAIPDNLLESELFGYKKGAFTGADRDKKGLIEAAQQGTLFLDEIGEMPLAMQVKLLRFLQEKEVQPLGSDKPVKADVRIITATNRDLADEIRAKRFREDLYYRLQVAEVFVPALRDRQEDVPFLARHFLKKFCEKEGLTAKRLSENALKDLADYNWPGNVRELENAIYRIAVFSENDLIDSVVTGNRTRNDKRAAPSQTPLAIPDDLGLNEAKKKLEKEMIQAALLASQGNVTHAAKRLQIARTRLSLLIREYDIEK